MNEQRLTTPTHDPYMMWRRLASIGRYVEGGVPGVIDVDSYEYCPSCYRPVAIVETKTEQGNNIWTATAALSHRLGVPGYLLRYVPGLYELPGNIPGGKVPADAVGFTVTNLAGKTKQFEPAEWAQHLVRLHECGCEK